jgi:hypothetical protein
MMKKNRVKCVNRKNVHEMLDEKWPELHRVLIIHLVELFPLYSWEITHNLNINNGMEVLVLAFDKICDIGGNFQLIDDTVTMTENGVIIDTAQFNEPDLISRVENFVRRKRLKSWECRD